MYKFADGSAGCYSASAGWTAATCTPEQAHNNAYGFDLGGKASKFSADVVFQHYNQAISVLNPLLGPQSLSCAVSVDHGQHQYNTNHGTNLIDPNDTVYGIVTDNNAVMVAAKYSCGPVQVFCRLRIHLAEQPEEPAGRRRLGPGRLFHEWRRRQQS